MKLILKNTYSVEKQNIHKELIPLIKQFPQQIENFDNMIVYGPSGVGKYSQVLYFLKKYSPTNMKYQTSITIENDKKKYSYNISDIHYEVDMALLGCNSKVLWHSIYQNVLDIVCLKPCFVNLLEFFSSIFLFSFVWMVLKCHLPVFLFYCFVC